MAELCFSHTVCFVVYFDSFEKNIVACLFENGELSFGHFSYSDA